MKEIKRRNKRKPIPNHGIEWIPYQKRFSLNLQKIMKQNDISKYELCNKSGVSLTAVDAYINGQTASPSLKHVSSIAHGLGVTIKEILE